MAGVVDLQCVVVLEDAIEPLLNDRSNSLTGRFINDDGGGI